MGVWVMVKCEKCGKHYYELEDSTCKDCKYIEVLKGKVDEIVYFFEALGLRHATLKAVNDNGQVFLENPDSSWKCTSSNLILTRDQVSLRDLKESLLDTLHLENLCDNPDYEEQKRLITEFARLLEEEQRSKRES